MHPYPPLPILIHSGLSQTSRIAIANTLALALSLALSFQPFAFPSSQPMTSFDPAKFIESSISGANSTKIIPCPIGEFQAVIDKIAPRQWQSKDGTQTGVALDVFWLVEDANVKEQLKRDTVTVKQGIMLDLTPSGEVDGAEGKNVGLGRLREAVGKNNPGELFTFSMLPGLMAKVKVGHRVVGEDTFAEVNAVAKF